MNKLDIFKGILTGVCFLGIAAHTSAQTKPKQAAMGTIQDTVPGRLFTIKKNRSTAAISTVSGETLNNTAAPNLTNTLYGRLPGLTVSQRSGEPGNDAALLGIRGIGSFGYLGGAFGYKTYKIFVDGFEVNDNYFNGLSPAEIESISVLKDAAALSTFGMRGANGVISATTKRGRVGKPSIQFQTRTGLQSATRINKPLDSYGYANLYNQAISNDNGNVWTPRYTPAQLQAYQNGTAPNVDWYNEVLRSKAPLTTGDLQFSGGDTIARYSLALDYADQKSLLNVGNTDATSNQMLKRYNIRTNLDFNLFKIFEARVDLNGRIEDVKQPNFGIGSLFGNLASYPSNIYNVHDGANWSGTALYPNNPAASVNALGFYNTHNRILQGNFGLKEKLDFITPGLYLNEAYSFNSYAQTLYGKSATYARYFNGATTTTDQNTPLRAFNQSAQQQQDWKQLMVTAGYERTFGNHQITSALNYHQSDFRGDGDFSFAYHYQNVSGRANYAYKGKYIAEFGFSYFGTDAYAPGNRWGFYPSVSGAWIVSEESFLKDSETIGLFKLRASVGKLGSADTEGTGISIGGLNGRYLYQQYYSGSGTFYLGNDGTPAGQTGISPVFIANKNIFAEKSIKYNVGADLTLFGKLNIQLDAFMDKRSDIIYPDYAIPASFGNNVLVKNLGRLTNKGFEASMVFTDKPGKVGYSISAMAAYNKNTVDYMAETAVAYPYNALTGRSYGTRIGLVSTGYYQLSDFNANGTLKSGIPVPAFGVVQPGDLRYQDLDNNGTVDDNDRTEIGKAGYPRLTYAFGGNINFAGFDLAVFLQGTYGSTVDILNSASSQTQAFVGNGNAYAIAQGAWAYYPDQGIDTRASATYPRLTTTTNPNNYRTSSFWIKSGDFLRIRNVELGYSFNSNVIRKIGMQKLRVFVNAVNPVTWSSLLKDYHMDPETLSGYPALKSFNTGISITF